jgi:uncharacterized membrane protein YhaH (DUF805 family)
MNYYIEVFRKYADFSGRARRSEYWFFTLFNTLITLVLALLGLNLVHLLGLNPHGAFGLAYLYLLVAFLPTLAVSVRRLHDIGLSGWWYLIVLVPFGALVLTVLAIIDSQAGANRFGPNPKDLTAAA